MPNVDNTFVLIALGALALLLAGSKVTRQIFWETVAHPFSRSRIYLRHGKIQVERERQGKSSPADGEVGAKAPEVGAH